MRLAEAREKMKLIDEKTSSKQKLDCGQLMLQIYYQNRNIKIYRNIFLNVYTI